MAQCTTGIYTIDYGTYCAGRHEIMSRRETYQNNCAHLAVAGRVISAWIGLLVAIDKSLGGINDEPSSLSLFTRSSNGFLCHIVHRCHTRQVQVVGTSVPLCQMNKQIHPFNHSWLYLYVALM